MLVSVVGHISHTLTVFQHGPGDRFFANRALCLHIGIQFQAIIIIRAGNHQSTFFIRLQGDTTRHFQCAGKRACCAAVGCRHLAIHQTCSKGNLCITCPAFCHNQLASSFHSHIGSNSFIIECCRTFCYTNFALNRGFLIHIDIGAILCPDKGRIIYICLSIGCKSTTVQVHLTTAIGHTNTCNPISRLAAGIGGSYIAGKGHIAITENV